MSNMVVQTNVFALNAHRNMKGIGAVQGKASSRLASGYRINSAADDAAGLAISEKMRAQIRGLDQASKNAQDGQALIQTAEGGMQEVDNMLQRIRELLVQAANDTNEHNWEGTGDRQKIQDEIDQLVQEIDSMADRVEFNKKKLIDGSFQDNVVAQKIAKSNVTSAKAKVTLASTALTTAKASYAKALASFSAGTLTASKLLMFKNALLKASAALTGAKQHRTRMNAAYSAAMKLKAKEPLWFQIGANKDQGMLVNIGSVKSDILGIGDGKGISAINILNNTGATATAKVTNSLISKRISSASVTGWLDTLDVALNYVTTERAKLGAAQNRMEYTMKSLDISSENLSDSESRVRNADMAKEMMNFTKANVLQQAAISMLAQANQLPQNLLQLLG